MKKLISTLFATLFVFSFVISQTIPRDKVVVEIGTGTWCPFCPGAAMGADDLVANGHEVAIIENHNGDAYTNAASNARNSYYNISGYPTAVFDGGNNVVGGSSTQSMYSNYLPVYNQKIAIPSHFSIDIEGSSSGLIDFNVNVAIEMVEPYSGNDIRVHCAITESHIEESWQGQSELNFVQRMMIPSYNGISHDFSANSLFEHTYSFSLDPSWVTEHCEIVIFLQEYQSKTILNGGKRELMEMGNINDYDASISNLTNLPEKTCAGTIEPVFNLRNNGNENLTDLTIQYQVNGGAMSTYNWSGNLAFLEEEEVTLPAITFSPEEENNVLIYSENPNGNPDQYPINDTIMHMLPGADVTPNDVSLIFRTDVNPEESTWELLDDQGNVVASGGPYEQSGQTIMESFELDDNSCYQFYFYDAGGDGLNAPGFFALYYGSNNYIIQGLGDFGSVISTDFTTDDATSVKEVTAETEVKVYPNPFSSYTNVVINTNTVSHISVNMYNMIGELVYQSDEGMLAAGEQNIRINGEGLQNGIYFVQLQVNEQIITEKVTIAR